MPSAVECSKLGCDRAPALPPGWLGRIGGRVRFVETINPDKGKRLRVIFEKIEWP
jgi:hypothetical protein